MSRYFSLHRWARWLPSSAHLLNLSVNGVELQTRNSSHRYEWAALPQPPEKKTFGFLHTISISTEKRTWRLYFLTRGKSDAAWKEIVRAWYIPRIIQAQQRIRYLEQRLFNGSYIRTSSWLPLLHEIETWQANQPTIPPEGLIEAEHRDLLLKTAATVRDPGSMLEQAREAYVERALAEYYELFEKVESHPLTAKQRRACVIDEDNNLILAGAGTGKTSTVIGRVAFLVKSGQAKPEEILLLAYGNKAAEEMRERLESKLGVEGVTAATFHALGRFIVQAVEGKNPAVSDMATNDKLKSKFINDVFEENQKDEAYQALLLTYFERWLHPARNPFDFKTLGDYYRYLTDNDVRTLKGEQVKGFGECDIANFLFKNGIDYLYESTYDTPLQSPQRGIYRPDFFLPESGIYIEHFGIDREGKTAPYIDRQKYTADMEWKRKVHAQGMTRLVETFHYEKQHGTLLEALEAKLTQAGVIMNPLPPESVLETLREFGAIKKFSIILKDMVGLLRSSNLSKDEQLQVIENSGDPDQIAAAFKLLAPIVRAYEDELRRGGNVDFDDMINRAHGYVTDGSFESPWKFIVVDEFQDISKSRAGLVQALRKTKRDVSLFCVGDDWQSIYRFTGSDISFTADFKERFGPTKVSYLDKTFRFNSKIGEVASRFVMKNKRQLAKDVKSHTVVDDPAVSLIRASLSRTETVDGVTDKIVGRISEIAAPGSTVYFLARFKHDLPNLTNLTYRFPNLHFKRDSIHSSKGKEADYVVLLGLGKGKFGLPSEIATHPLIEALLPKAEAFPHAEERRLFYVALTRAKHRVYLVCDMLKRSPFVQELLDEKYAVQIDEFQTSQEQINAGVASCSVCMEGQLVGRVNSTTNKAFLGCSNFPRCHHTESSCPKCASPLQPFGRFRVCSLPPCDGWIAMCPLTGGEMVLRKNNRWGCTHFRGYEMGSCRHMENYIAAPQRFSH